MTPISLILLELKRQTRLEALVHGFLENDSRFQTIMGKTYTRHFWTKTTKKRLQNPHPRAGVLLRILVAGERCNITGEYFEKGSISE